MRWSHHPSSRSPRAYLATSAGRPLSTRLPLVALSLLTLLLFASVPVAAIGAGQPGVTIRTAAPAVEGSTILGVAMQALGTFQGECFPWVRRTVQQATGRTIGFDYGTGYLEAGAVEVPLGQAQAGDIIQLVNDLDDGPDADYPGMHTSIVVQPTGAGVFRVIDSNLGFDGVVRIREDYNPMALAGRYAGINVHVYRFPGQSEGSTTSSTPVAVPSNQLVAYNPAPGSGTTAASQQATSTATVRAQGDCLRLRSAPSTSAAVLTCLADGSTVTLLPGTQQAEGVQWQAVSAGGLSGWVSSQYLAVNTTSPAPAATSTPPPAAQTTTPPVSASASQAAAVIGDVPKAGGLALVVFTGGSTESLVAHVSSRGCAMISVWTNRAGGGLLGMIPGAPAVVNREWSTQFPTGTLEAQTPLIIVCRGAASGTEAPAPSAPAPGSSTVGGAGPPGPAGNE